MVLGLNLKQSWLSVVKYLVLFGLVIWIWRTIRTDSAEYFTNGLNQSERLPEGFDTLTDTPIVSDNIEINGALNHDGKRWRKLHQKIADGEIQISVTAAGQELDMDDMIIPWVDSLIADDDKASKHREYLKYKSKKQD